MTGLSFGGIRTAAPTSVGLSNVPKNVRLGGGRGRAAGCGGGGGGGRATATLFTRGRRDGENNGRSRVADKSSSEIWAEAGATASFAWATFCQQMPRAKPIAVARQYGRGRSRSLLSGMPLIVIDIALLNRRTGLFRVPEPPENRFHRPGSKAAADSAARSEDLPACSPMIRHAEHGWRRTRAPSAANRLPRRRRSRANSSLRPIPRRCRACRAIPMRWLENSRPQPFLQRLVCRLKT